MYIEFKQYYSNRPADTHDKINVNEIELKLGQLYFHKRFLHKYKTNSHY